MWFVTLFYDIKQESLVGPFTAVADARAFCDNQVACRQASWTIWEAMEPEAWEDCQDECLSTEAQLVQAEERSVSWTQRTTELKAKLSA